MTRVRGSPRPARRAERTARNGGRCFGVMAAPAGWGDPAGARSPPRGSEEETTMTNPTPERPRDVADMPPEERERQYHAAMAAADVDAAEVSFAGRCPRTGPRTCAAPGGEAGLGRHAPGDPLVQRRGPMSGQMGPRLPPTSSWRSRPPRRSAARRSPAGTGPRSSRPWRWRAGTTRSSGGLRP